MEIFGIPVPEELTAQLEKQDMVADSHRHDISRLFQELERDHLLTLRLLFHEFSGDSEGQLSSYYEGIVCATIAHRFDVCPGCGKNHENELLLRDKTGSLDEGFSEEQIAQMEEYNLDDLRDEITLQLIGFICKNCGLRYPSIKDRMLRPVDACHGCHLKSAHG